MKIKLKEICDILQKYISVKLVEIFETSTPQL